MWMCEGVFAGVCVCLGATLFTYSRHTQGHESGSNKPWVEASRPGARNA